MANNLISREAALEILMRYCPDDDGSCSKADVDPREMLDEIENIPAIDAAPVVHGRWKYFHKQNIAVCLNCSFERDLDANFGAAVACPNCGAFMK